MFLFDFVELALPTQNSSPITTSRAPATKSHLQSTTPFFNTNFKPSPREEKIQSNPNMKNKLSQTTVAWITGGICVGSVALIFTLACGFYFIRKRHSGHFSTPYKQAAAATRGSYGTPSFGTAAPELHSPSGYPHDTSLKRYPKASVAL